MTETHRFIPTLNNDAETMTSDQLFSRAGHDLCQPFQAMGLFIHLLGRTLVTQEQQQLLSHIQQSNTVGEVLLRNILDVAALRAGRRRIQVEHLLLSDILTPHLPHFQELAKAKGLKLRLKAMDTIVWGDRGMIGLILKHFVENALRYTQKGGILIGCRPDHNGTRICVYDTGCGISADMLPHIFEDFYQNKSKDFDPTQSSGLGLPIARLAAQSMKGSIAVSSTEGKGSLFELRLPKA